MRRHGDQWGIAESVGVTALGVAAGRAIESRRSDGLVDDPYAEAFVVAATPRVRLPSGPNFEAAWTMQSTYIGVRSRFFDLFCAAAAAEGITQVVILAAGLDTRALRLDWPAGSVVYEVDQAGVFEFKNGVLAGCRAGRSAHRVVVPADLREDWPTALLAAGFDPARPSAWLAEGLLPYLPAQAEADLFDRVHQLSVPGSRMAVEHLGPSRAGTADRAQPLSEVLGVDIADLMYLDEREDPGDRLRRYGWDVARVQASEFAQANGRFLNDDGGGLPTRTVLIEATLRSS